MNNEQLRQMIAGGETARVEFKESVGASTVHRAVCAQSNWRAGLAVPGHILIGVADDGRLVGIAGTDDNQQRLAQVRLDGSIVPTPNMDVALVDIDGVTIGVLTVMPSASAPLRLKGVAYVRIGTTTGPATPDEERLIRESRSAADQPFDARGLGGSSLSDLDLPRFSLEYLRQAVSPEVLAENGRSVEQQLASLQMTDLQGLATPTGLLSVGVNPRHWLPGAYIQFRRIDGDKITDDTLDQAEYSGTIVDMVRQIEEKLSAYNRESLTLGGGAHTRAEAYPMVALQQLLRNAVMHRDYMSYTPVRVSWFNDRIEITNPGQPFGIAPQDFGKPGLTAYRNPNIAGTMKVNGLAERFGIGLQLVQASLERNSNPRADLAVEGEFTICVVRARP